MKLPAPQIEQCHCTLCDLFQRETGAEVSLLHSRDDWQDVMVGTAVFFELLAENERQKARYSPARGHPAWVVLPFPPDEGAMTVGVGWHEEWEAIQDGFSLQHMGWSFYWGDYLSQNRLFRAEWAPSQAADTSFGQPHWHFDRKLVAEFFGAGEREDAVQEIGFKRLHLPMGAWDNTVYDANCWRRDIATVASTLDWTMKTLIYGISELERLSKGELVK